MRRLAALVVLALAGCATDGTGGSVDFYGGYHFYDDWWYAGGGCCVDYPGDIGPPAPRPEHPIALPPGGERPSHPIADRPSVTPSTSRSTPAPRPAAPMRGGGMRGGGGRR